MKTEQEITNLFQYCGISVRRVWKIENQYWPQTYKEERESNPWWLVLTWAGIVEIGPRKRVISIDWSETDVRHIIPEAKLDDVTVSETYVHAWDEGKLISYLKGLAPLLNIRP